MISPPPQQMVDLALTPGPSRVPATGPIFRSFAILQQGAAAGKSLYY